MKAAESGDGNQVRPRRQREGDGVRSNRNQKGLQQQSRTNMEEIPKTGGRSYRDVLAKDSPRTRDDKKECHEYGEAGVKSSTVKSGDKAGRDNPIVDLTVDTGINGVAGDCAGVVAGEKSIVHEDSDQTLHGERGGGGGAGALNAAQRPSTVFFFNSRDGGDINKRVIREREDQAQRSPDFLPAYAKSRKRPRRDDPFGLNELLGLDTVFSPSGPDLQPQGVGSTEVDNNPILDLNCRHVSSSQNSFVLEPLEEGEIVSDTFEDVAQRNGGGSGTNSDHIEGEIKDTIDLGRMVGADLQNFRALVKKAILVEGFNVVDQ
ncbi:hypothetical protein L1987_44286 [Smallanthus sonchifolius]|uniref:Uncharacterized protein n=1 Tax=Smallanthus sonchifolius TaxID=185202 RepID=A0ACB9GPS2_9ASTR|nr:hypothetical protein L1987_44286 [Smallanthus sonchifolius]